MALKYGMNITASDMKALLEKNDKLQTGVRTWRQLFGNASLGYNAQSDALSTYYGDAISKAYASSFKQNDAIVGAGLNAGITKEMLATSRNDLHAAYETYVHNYNSNAEQIAENYSNEVGVIDEALTQRATNFSNLYNNAYKYLSEELFGSVRNAEGNASNGATPIYEGEGDDAKITGYSDVTLDYMDEHGLSWLYEEDETGERKLRSWESISHDLMNDDGTLTKKGVMFFDQMFNTPYEEYTRTNKDGEEIAIRSFDKWLSETDSELRDWWVSQDPFNYNFAGTNKGTSQIIMGRESTDTKYAPHQYASTQTMSDILGVNESARRNFDKSSDKFEGAVNDVYARFKRKMGGEAYTQFQSENKEFLDEYRKILKTARAENKDNKSFSDETANLVTKWYDELLRRMDMYIKKHVYTGKTSGF